MKKNKNILLIFCVIICVTVFSTVNLVSANVSGGGGYGGGSMTGTCNNTFCSGFETTYESGSLGSAFKIQLVYYDGAIWNVLAQGIIYNGNNSQVIQKINSRTERYLNTPTATAFAERLWEIVYANGSDDEVTNWFNDNNSANFKALAQEMGVHSKDLSNKSTKDRNINSIGYRFIVQKLVAFNGGFQSRKEFAANNSESSGSNCLNGIWHVANGSCVGTFRDLYTRFDDIGISAPGLVTDYLGRNISYWGYDRLRLTIENSNNPSGSGYGIYEFENPYENQYDYTIDAACTNCQDTTSSGSFIIQDINNWEAIEASNRYNGDNANIRTYYYKNDNTYCREEIKVDFPDTSKVINVQTGRYFTVGASENDIGYSLDKNFGDISVTRTRECQGAGATSYTQSHPFGTQTEAEGTVDNGTGIVTLKYTENILNGSQYDKDEITLIAKDCQESINAGTRTMTCKYGLPNYVYRYVKDGQSLYDGRNDSSTIDLGIPNLPISFNNYSTPRATVQLAYELPNDSQLKKSYIKDNTYLNSGDVDNIYKKYIEGSMNGESDQNELNKSACAKLYGGTNTAGFRVCAQNRTNNKIGNNSSSNCVTRNTLSSGNLSERYICPITGNDENGKICEYDSIADIYYGKNGTAVSKEQFDKECDGSPNDKICKYDDSTDTYYGKNGTVVSQEQYYEQCPQECTVINGVYYGKMNSDGTGRKVTQDVYAEECLKYCTIETVNGQTIYYDLQGNASTDPNVEGGYNDDCVSKVTCPPEQCEYGCCPDGSCADSEGNCPFTTPGNNIIYRPIDLINPFPSQNAMIRATGSNWCAYNIRTNKIDCSADNAIVKAHINNNRSTDDYDIYSSEPLYEVVLTPDTIKAVRNYNNRQEKAGGYGDYTLNCNGTVGCYSTFLREEGIVSFSGECSKLGSLKTCAERR